MRLFVSIPVAQRLSYQAQSLPKSIKQANWIAPQEYHITLRFIGDVESHQLEGIQERLSAVRKKKFTVEAKGLDSFESEKKSILYAKIVSVRNIIDLAAKINEKLLDLGFEMPNKPFVPHVTIAKVNNSKFLPKYIAAQQGRIQAAWPVKSFTLMQSTQIHEQNQGYRSLQVYDLQSFS